MTTMEHERFSVACHDQERSSTMRYSEPGSLSYIVSLLETEARSRAFEGM
jgi:hypothetical protein